MKSTFFLLLLLAGSLLFADGNYEKALSSQIRSEVYAQDLTDAGEYEKANAFLEKALKRYPRSDMLLMLTGTSYFNLKQLDEAKKYFRLVLEIDPRNELASKFIKMIDEQQSAKENEAVVALLDYLYDKGFDFLMIFLAFLGGEIIARKYADCNASATESLVDAFKHKSALASSIAARLRHTITRCCFSKNALTFCFFLEILVNVVIATTLLIVWLLAEFMSGTTVFLDSSIAMLSTEELWRHVLLIFAIAFILTLLLRLWNKTRAYDSRPERYGLVLAERLETLYSEREYSHVYDLIASLSNKELEALLQYIHDDAVRIFIEKECPPRVND